jgi:PPK2 family polyphosphate:nucleotide phosphotransferase
MKIIPSDFLAQPEKKCKLHKFPTAYSGKTLSKEKAADLLEKSKQELAELQDKLYAHNRFRVLIVLQAMDAAGKDSTIKHLMSGFNPSGVRVANFKVPNSTELDHDYLWRHYLQLPGRGEIGIFNRSHYENVLVTRVHPSYILNENLPGINSLEDIKSSFWEKRLEQIKNFEQTLFENGTLVLKFFLHLSKEEQKKRFIERIDDPSKNWKFSFGDLEERKLWDDYQNAYQEAISATSTKKAPWFIVPADDKWYTRIVIAEILFQKINELDISYPLVSDETKKALAKAKAELLNEK